MERGTSLVDYGHGGSAPRATPSFRNSDIDYRDVFGGPPRRTTVHEMMRYSFTEGADSIAGGGIRAPSFRDPWMGAEEVPVYDGGGDGLNRRLYVREDFFVDIFGGSESPSSPTPRKPDRDVFSASSPGSAAVSPARPLPPRAPDSFLGLSSGPAQFSLPDKLSKSVDSPALGSSNRTSYKDVPSDRTSHLHSPKISMFGFGSSRIVQEKDESRNSGSHYRPSPLSQRFSFGTAEDSPTSAKLRRPDDREKGESNPQSSPQQFHFSIYKWASKGVPLMIPLRRASSLRTKQKAKTESSSFNERMGTISQIPESPSATPLDIGSPSDSTEVLSSQIPEAVGDELNNNKEDISVPTSSKEMNGVLREAGRTDSKPLHAFIDDIDNDQSGDVEDVIVAKAGGGTSRISKGSARDVNNDKDFKRRDEKLPVKASEEAADTKAVKKESPRNSEDRMGRRRSKGKVKEFIRIFNQEIPTKTKTSVHPQDQSFTKKETGNPVATEEANIHNRSVPVTERRSTFDKEKPREDPIIKVVDKEHSATNSTDVLFSDESAPCDARVIVEDADDSTNAYFTIQELPPDDNQQQPSTKDREEIQAIDAKIRQWSRGKEGNIRSLLSTLQYVLWPGSGWKPVPLVDIIEGPAVKRSYQRALLYLHPDKLQQKGAASHQKYIAEQVFDILQEAWTHFNTLGAL